MRVSYRWLRELLPALDVAPAVVRERLTASGLAVDAMVERGAGLANVVLARVEAIARHPERSGLSVVDVSGRGGARQRVVCGASNVPEPGGLVVLAPVGTELPNGLTLTARNFGTVTSEGMLVSEEELGLAQESDGILVLPPGAADPGTSFLEACPEACDTVFELDLTPNRPDALGHVGVARELAALFELDLVLAGPGTPNDELDERAEKYIKIENHDLERCPHYSAAVVVDVTIAPSPAWMRWRLHALGVRPISNVVDITNLLLLLYGQPLHAFDLDRVRGGVIHVRRAARDEPFTTLDGVARRLDPDDLVIADGAGPTALAGVMGGADSEIRETTRRVLIECAYFLPSGVRRAARRHALHTESSHRFERGVDWGGVPNVLRHARKWMSDLSGGKAVRGEIHAQGSAPELPRILLRSSRMDRLLGTEVAFGPALSVLERLGFSVESRARDADGERAVLGGASFRPDVGREVDLIEEVARVRGLDALPSVIPAIAERRGGGTRTLERRLSEAAASLGLSEALTYAFVSPDELTKVRAPAPSVRLSNPLSEERSVMRTSLLPGLLDALGRARRHGENDVRLFTLGSCFLSPNELSAPLPVERRGFAAVLAGERPAYLELKTEELDVFDAAGLAAELVFRVCRRPIELAQGPQTEATRHLHPRGAARIVVDEKPIGVLGPLHPDVVDAFALAGPVHVIEFDLDALARVETHVPQYRPLPKLPAVVRDLSLVVSDQVSAAAVRNSIERAAGALCESVELVALFRGGSVPEGQRSLTFRIVYRDRGASGAAERTLTDREVDASHEVVVQAAERELGATLRT